MLFGHVILKIYMSCDKYMCCANICTSPAKLLNTAGKISTCSDWKISCPEGTYSTVPVWETKFLEHSPDNKCPLYVLYKIPPAQANFLLAQLKIHSHWRALVSLTAVLNIHVSTSHGDSMPCISTALSRPSIYMGTSGTVSPRLPRCYCHFCLSIMPFRRGPST